MTARFHRVYALLATVVVLAAVVYGFTIVGSPERRRIEKLDERRLQDLQAIVYEIQRMVADPRSSKQLRRELPANLDLVAAEARYRQLTLSDPETGEPYTYEVIDPTTYRLCATFSLERNQRHDVFWNHGAGRHCFTIDALDPP